MQVSDFKCYKGHNIASALKAFFLVHTWRRWQQLNFRECKNIEDICISFSLPTQVSMRKFFADIECILKHVRGLSLQCLSLREKYSV